MKDSMMARTSAELLSNLISRDPPLYRAPYEISSSDHRAASLETHHLELTAWNGKADILRLLDDGDVDANDLALLVHHGAARVAGVQRSIGLEQAVLTATDDTDRELERVHAERIAERHDLLAERHAVRVTELECLGDVHLLERAGCGWRERERESMSN